MAFALPKHAFADRAGRHWLLVLNYGLAQRINASLEVDFANAHNGECFKKLAASDELLVSVLFALVEVQAKESGVTPEAFAEAFDGEIFEAAQNAIGEMVALFTRPAMRPVIEAMLARGSEGRTAAIELATNKINSPVATAAIERQLANLDRQLDAALAQDPTSPSMATASPTSGPPSLA